MYGIVLGVGLGLVSAIWKDSWADYIARVIALIGVSFPVFLIALIFLNVFYAQLSIAAGPGRLHVLLRPPPTVTGMYTIDALLNGDWKTFGNALSHLILPALTLALIHQRHHLAHHPLFPARSPESRLHAHRPRQGPARALCHRLPWHAQFADSGGDGHRLVLWKPAWSGPS